MNETNATVANAATSTFTLSPSTRQVEVAEQSGAPLAAPLEPATYDAVIFDLGGVLLDLDVPRTISALSELFQTDAHAFYTQARQVELFDRFECGLISAATFRNELRLLLSSASNASDEAIDHAWSALLGSFPLRKIQLLKKLAASKRVFLLSNTNEIHLQRFIAAYDATYSSTFGPWSQLFEKDHYSHVLGYRKPDPRAFQALLTTHGLDAPRTAFIDDNLDNIRAAEALGLQTRYHTTNAPLDVYFDGL